MEVAANKKQIEYDNNFCLRDIKRYLVDRFLYDSDSESINILLNIYDIDDCIDTICPTYISLKKLKKDIIKFLSYKEGKELIAYNLSNLIHNDVNRFELFLYLEGYKAGLNSVRNVNRLEILTFKYFSIEDLYSRNALFNYEIRNQEILALKNQINEELIKDLRLKKHISDIVFKFNLHLLKRKVFNLNAHLDRQLVLNLDAKNEFDSKIKETNSQLSKKELNGLNIKILKFLYRDAIKIFSSAYWDGVNDKVIKRYK